MGLCQARPGTADCRAEAVSCLGHSYLWPWGAHCLNDVTVGPGQVPPLVGRSASVAAGDLGGHTGQSPSLHVVSSSIACCVGLHGNTPGGLQAFSGIRYGGSCCKFNELVAHCCLGAAGGS